jgi:hypothetical protein
MIEVFNYVDEHNDENFNDFEEEFVNDEIIEVADRIELHPPIPHNSIHCPPLEDTDDGFNMTFNNDTCNCYTYGANFEPCCRLWGENSEINWTSVRAEATASCDDPNRILSNNQMRKQLYKLLYRQCDVGDNRGERIELSRCGVAKIRQIYPSDTGSYMGFLAN